MRKTALVGAFCIVAVLSAGIAFALDIGIQVSPNVIVLRSKTPALTVHTTIQAGTVATGTVTLNGTIAPTSTFADDNGDLVARFNSDQVKGIASPPSVTLTLTGVTRDGEQFQGSQTVLVKDH